MLRNGNKLRILNICRFESTSEKNKIVESTTSKPQQQYNNYGMNDRGNN